MVRTYRLTSRFSIACLVLLTVVMWSSVAAQQATSGTSAKSAESIDQQLLDDLHPPSPAKPVEPMDPARKSAQDGEDIGQPTFGQSWQIEIARKMRNAETLLQEMATASAATELQQEIADDLGQLIDRLERQRETKRSSNQRRASQNKNSTGEGPSSGEPEGASNSKTAKGRPGTKDLQQWPERIWGVLPDRVQQQLQHFADEQFLPQYEAVIREYYEQLSERRERR